MYYAVLIGYFIVGPATYLLNMQVQDFIEIGLRGGGVRILMMWGGGYKFEWNGKF